MSEAGLQGPEEEAGPSMGARSVEASIALVTQVATLGFTFATGILAARIFSVAQRGEYGMFMTLTSFVVVFTTFGLPEALVYFHRQGQADRARIATSVLAGTLFAALLAVAGCALLAPSLAARYFPEGGTELVWLAFAAGVATVLLRNATAFLQARHRFLRSGTSNLLLPLLFTVALLAVGAADLGLRVMGQLYGVACIIAGVVAFRPFFPLVRPATIDGPYVSMLSRFSLKSYAQAIVNQLNYRLDVFIVATLLGSLTDVAYYHVAAGVAGLLWVVPDSYGQVIYPRMAASTNERERSLETIRGIRVVVVAVGIGATLTGLAAPWIVPLLFGEEYREAVPLLLLLLPGVLAMSASKILTRYFVSQNRHQLNTLFILVAVAVGIAANLVLIPRIGVQGAAIASSLAYAAMALGLAAAFLRSGDIRGKDLRHFPAREFQDGVGAMKQIAARHRGGPQ